MPSPRQKKNHDPAPKPKTHRFCVYNPDYCDLLIIHMSKGYSFESFAGQIGCAVRTLHQWVEDRPEFKEAYAIGKSKCLHWWETQGIDGLYNVTTRDADGGSSTVSINSALWIFNMKNRFNWRDKQEVTADVQVEDKKSSELNELMAWVKNISTHQ